MKFLLFGTGNMANQVMEGILNLKRNIEIIGVIDNDETKHGGKFFQYTIAGPERIKDYAYDYICILLGKNYADVYTQLVYGYHIQKDKIVDRFFLLKVIMTEKYRESEDRDIQDTISFWQKNNLSFFNQFEYVPARYEKVFWDMENNMPFILYERKRLYYPRNYDGFFVKDDELYVVSYRDMEQHMKSPHRYLTDSICFEEGDIVVDAGAREGDFALPYIEKSKKLYLIECDSGWVKALQMTYKDYKDKVIIVPKMLSDKVTENSTTLMETLGNEKVTFIKMDIEGAETKALSVSGKLFKNNNIKCAICSYHKKNDKDDIEKILKKFGYRCSESKGYVVFVADPDIFKEADFRRGIIYAQKDCPNDLAFNLSESVDQ